MDDIEERLKELDQVNAIIKGMKDGASDAERAKFTQKADQLIASQKSRDVYNATRINDQPKETLDPTFAAMERDAEERFQRKVIGFFFNPSRFRVLEKAVGFKWSGQTILIDT